ncbi:drug/Metabolite transporter superfamily [Thecamonas trahens ATCC 50062]|uniref:Drug/Metabolite transporter superfamily n=1 Tax=Thecamonas trahens ATCC 50062 TaxID=461836 RepID=A0A0L0DJC8_THETB|nr:drug/Metabolite transporter superfamily [Thecamonas trahens ATCC 50062]KNC52171.1 drug/Metabolite transporter superfamily [Thecamonas trahens ATCC 50062]|eukprot:XP_013762174.1 drug/Metabolite transporter superfamily [Thecamonas trahens ATCC 50062]
MVKVVQLAVAIYVAYLVYGVAQERIYKTPRGDDGARFSYTLFVVLVQCIFNACVAAVMMWWTDTPANTTPLYKYAAIGFTYIGAMFCSINSLVYVDMVTQVVAKCCKPIPVLLLGLVLFGKRYTAERLVCVVMLCTQSKMEAKGKIVSTWTGWLLLGMSLFLDGLTGNIQERVRAAHKCTTFQLMFYTNVMALVYICMGLAVTQDADDAVAFIIEHPDTVIDLLIFSTASALGQIAIFLALTSLGALLLTIITTTRKFFTILLSLVWFGHSLAFGQWIGIAVVFSALAIDIAASKFDFRITEVLGLTKRRIKAE